MKKGIALFLIISTVLLPACRLPAPQSTSWEGTGNSTTVPATTTQPTDTNPTDPHPTDPHPTEPPYDVLAKFDGLFGQLGSWYNMALLCQYTSPTQIKLEYLFYHGFDGETREPTDAEWEQLKDRPGFVQWKDLIRLPVDRMNQVLKDMFGITLADVEAAGFENLVYLESTNCYYHMVTDAMFAEDFRAISVEKLEDGTIRLYYTLFGENAVYAVTVIPYADGYRILSNVRVS